MVTALGGVAALSMRLPCWPLVCHQATTAPPCTAALVEELGTARLATTTQAHLADRADQAKGMQDLPLRMAATAIITMDTGRDRRVEAIGLSKLHPDGEEVAVEVVVEGTICCSLPDTMQM